MPHYPGQQPRRWPYAVVAVVVAAGVGLLVGRITADDSSAGASPSAKGGGPACPGGQDDVGRRAAAACLVQSYFALGQASDRDDRLGALVVPGQVESARRAYKALDAKVAQEYAAVAATNLSGSGTTVDGKAWVAFVDSYKDDSTPLAQWWITSFQMRWQGSRWWLSGGVDTTLNATPSTAGSASANGFGPGWVAASAS